MSGNKKRPRLTSTSTEKCQEPKIDEDLLCLICKELVVSAKQVNCCGGLFCKECIYTWINNQSTGNRLCPSCRVVLNTSNIVADLRSDRKSAAQPRRCPYHQNHGCEFIGTRQEVAAHKLDCPCDPDRCISQRCKTKIAEWEAEKASWEAEKAVCEARHAEQAKQIQELQEIVQAKNGFIAAAWMSPDETLKKAYGLDGVKFCTIDSAGIYTIKVRNAARIFLNVEIECVEAHYNVSLFCSRPSGSVAPPGGFPKLKVEITLISFDQSATKDKFDEFVLESDLPVDSDLGCTNWLTSGEFQKYAKDGKFNNLGWTVTAV